MDEETRRLAVATLYELPGHLLWRASARVTSLVGSALPAGIDLHAYAALLALAEHEPQSQQGLARLTAVSGTTMTAVAEALGREGLVARVRNPEDRRSYSLTRTPAGRTAVREWEPHVTRLEQQLTEPLTAGEVSRLHEILHQIVADQLHEDTPPQLLATTGFLIVRAHQVSHREFMTALEPLGIEPRHFGTLRALRIAGPATQGGVAGLLDVSPATVVQLVDQLESSGLVFRERSAADRRAYGLHLTDRAHALLDAAQGPAVDLLADRIGDERSPTRHDLVRLLRLLLTSPAP
jgi:DNA-binding MarR family transcriptional regulator